MKIGIYGTGVFALALSSILTDNKHSVTLYTKFKEEKDELIKNKGSKRLPKYKINEKIKITNDLDEMTKDKDFLIIALPVPFIEDVLKKSNLKDASDILIASKGITKDKLLVSELVKKYTSGSTGVISGPTFASDVVTKKPLSFTVGVESDDFKSKINLAFKNDYVKLEYKKDIEIIELLGSIKNVYAIISGMLDGLGATTSTKSLFMTEAIKEEEKISDNFGGLRDDAISFAGVGDLILTCGSTESRNYSFGKIIGEKGINAAKNYLKENTVEGYDTINNIAELVLYGKIESKLMENLINILNGVCQPERIIETLMTN